MTQDVSLFAGYTNEQIQRIFRTGILRNLTF